MAWRIEKKQRKEGKNTNKARIKSIKNQESTHFNLCWDDILHKENYKLYFWINKIIDCQFLRCVYLLKKNWCRAHLQIITCKKNIQRQYCFSELKTIYRYFFNVLLYHKVKANYAERYEKISN